MEAFARTLEQLFRVRVVGSVRNAQMLPCCSDNVLCVLRHGNVAARVDVDVRCIRRRALGWGRSAMIRRASLSV